VPPPIPSSRNKPKKVAPPVPPVPSNKRKAPPPRKLPIEAVVGGEGEEGNAEVEREGEVSPREEVVAALPVSSTPVPVPSDTKHDTTSAHGEEYNGVTTEESEEVTEDSTNANPSPSLTALKSPKFGVRVGASDLDGVLNMKKVRGRIVLVACV